MIDEETRALTERLGTALGELPEVRLALLFGSRARGRARPDSDIDVGVLLDADTARADRGRTIRRLAGHLGRVVQAALVDLVVLNDAPALLRHRVIRDGVVLLQRTPEDRVRFWTTTVRDYQDGHIRREWFTTRPAPASVSDSARRLADRSESGPCHRRRRPWSGRRLRAATRWSRRCSAPATARR